MKKPIQYLEELFISELPNYQDKYPPQLKKSVAIKLIEKGLIQEVEILDQGLKLICHQLTHRGRIAYCKWVSEQQERKDH